MTTEHIGEDAAVEKATRPIATGSARSRVAGIRRRRRESLLRRASATTAVLLVVFLSGPTVMKGLIAGTEGLLTWERSLAKGLQAWAARPTPAPATAASSHAIANGDANGPLPAHGARSAGAQDVAAASAGAVRTAGQTPFSLRDKPPTPVFASAAGVTLHLPVELASLTILGYHQATNPQARPLRAVRISRDAYQGSPVEGFGPPIPQAVRVLKMYRSGRSGSPTRAVDVGAPAGSTVLSPVDGTVAELKPYKLYGITPDIEVHIRPDSNPKVEVVLIHLDGLMIRPGERLVAGSTPIAKVRRLSGRLTLQLGFFSHDAGNHVHLQVNTPYKAPGPHAID